MILGVELTKMSADEYRLIRSGQMTPAMAAQYLREERITLRSFNDTLRELYPQPDIQSRLVSAFQQDDPDANPDSIGRKIRNWLSGQNKPTNREDIFHIAFALSLSEPQANFLLGLCTDYGIHYREGRDVIYAWFLRSGRSYTEARDFFLSLPPVSCPTQIPSNPSSHLTHELCNDFQRVQTPEALRECYLANLNNFGELHVRAYSYFQRYLDQLIHPAAAWGGTKEPDYSIEAVMDQYFSLQMPSGKDRRGYTVVQKLVKHNWPNATALKNIRNRREDVPRKLLLLLYVITENILDDTYNELDEDYITLEERVEDHWYSLNAILTDCGMPLLDPRNPTDWLVLYAITADDDEPMSERMEQVIEYMFSDIK